MSTVCDAVDLRRDFRACWDALDRIYWQWVGRGMPRKQFNLIRGYLEELVHRDPVFFPALAYRALWEIDDWLVKTRMSQDKSDLVPALESLRDQLAQAWKALRAERAAYWTQRRQSQESN